jgi:hypothetical protein
MFDNIPVMGAAAAEGAAMRLPELIDGSRQNEDVPVIIDLPSEPGLTGAPTRPTVRIPFPIEIGDLTLIIQSDGRPGRFLGIGIATRKFSIAGDLGAIRILQVDYESFEGVPHYEPHYHVQPDINAHQPMP